MTNSPHYEDLPLKFTDDETNLNASEFNLRISNLDSRIYANENKLANIEPNATGDMTGKEIIDEINNEITTKINKNKLPSDVTYEDSLDVHNAHLNDRDNPHQVTKEQVLSGNEIKNSDISQSANIHPSKLYHGANNQYGMNEITGIQTALDGKSNVGHTHSHNELTELNDDDHPHYLYTKPGARPAGQEYDGMLRDLDMHNNDIKNVKKIVFNNGAVVDPAGMILPVESDNITIFGDGASEKLKSIAKLGTYIAGENVYKGDLVYQEPTDGMVYRTTTVNGVAKDINNIIGFAIDDVDVGLPVEVVQGDGSIYELPALTSIAKGKRYTISDTAGLIQVLQEEDTYSLPLVGVGISSIPPMLRLVKAGALPKPEPFYNGITGLYKVGGPIVKGTVVYQSPDDGLLYTADIMNNIALFSIVGIAIDSGNVNDDIKVLQGHGAIYEYEGEDWVEAGKPYTYDSGGVLVPYNFNNFLEPLVAVGINESTVRFMATVYSSGKEGGMAVYDNGTKNGTYQIDWANGSWQKIMIDDDITLTFTKPSVIGTYRLDIYKGGDESITLDEYDLFTIDGESYEATESELGIAKDALIFTFNGADFDLIASQNFRRVS